jgi:hypothetical protein
MAQQRKNALKASIKFHSGLSWPQPNPKDHPDAIVHCPFLPIPFGAISVKGEARTSGTEAAFGNAENGLFTFQG